MKRDASRTRVFPLAVRPRSTMSPRRSRFLLPKKRSTLPAKYSTSAAAGCSDFFPLVFPLKTLTAAEMREVDRLTTERFGISSTQLMENAGAAVAEFVLHEISLRFQSPARQIVVLCGKGNNGGDGLAPAQPFRQGVLPPPGVFFSPAPHFPTPPPPNFHPL